MRFHNGQLHNERDVTICMRAYSPKQEMNFEEYLPVVVLALIMGVLLVSGLLF
ncbi:MAG: hypothetical protein PHH47_11800 [Gallionella sp.]|nr:hypothetical protein [Gallionella sp.]MDD4946414.1 hypothetical protein [Gallionella sp.]MDD5611690.1 hypothetical protein [Gallionella sp.]